MINKKIKKLLIVYLIIISFNSNCFARYYETLNSFSANAKIAEPIFIVEELDPEIKLDVNKKTINKEYSFLLKNYIVNENINRISEVTLGAKIQIIHSNDSFPVKCELYDCNTGEELLNGKNITDEIIIQNNSLFEKKYKLVVSWKEKEDMASIDDIDIIIDASQKLN